MNTKHLFITLAAILALLFGTAVFFYAERAKAPALETITDTQDAPSSAVDTTPNATSTREVREILYTRDGFDPAVLTLSAGETITFTNKSGEDFWPASNEHPTHAAYPGFDAKTKIADGKTYEFIFTKQGAWGYHNHLNPKMMGVVVVK